MWKPSQNVASVTATAAASATIALNATSVRNMIAVGTCVWCFPNTPPTSFAVTDNVNPASYVQADYGTTSDSGSVIHTLSSNLGGNLTITVNPSGVTGDSQDITIFATEFEGGLDVPASGTPATANGATRVPISGSTTPDKNDTLILALVNTDSGNPIIESLDYTLIAKREGGSDANGSFVYKILSGSVNQPQSTRWSTGFEVWSTVIAAYAPIQLEPIVDACQFDPRATVARRGWPMNTAGWW